MSRLGTRRRYQLRSFPRVSGDEPVYEPLQTMIKRFSPRERG